MSNIGFIGLGIMGKPMAGHLVAGGHTLFVHTRKPTPQDLVGQGAVPCQSAREVAQRAQMARHRRAHDAETDEPEI